MGHYYSEMVSDEDQLKEIREREQRLKDKAERIQQLINTKGLARFLAEHITGV